METKSSLTQKYMIILKVYYSSMDRKLQNDIYGLLHSSKLAAPTQFQPAEGRENLNRY